MIGSDKQALEEVMAEAQRFDRLLYDHYRAHRNPFTPSGGKSATTFGPSASNTNTSTVKVKTELGAVEQFTENDDPMSLNAIDVKRLTTRPFKKLTDPEREYCRKDGLCFYCRRQGH